MEASLGYTLRPCLKSKQAKVFFFLSVIGQVFFWIGFPNSLKFSVLFMTLTSDIWIRFPSPSSFSCYLSLVLTKPSP